MSPNQRKVLEYYPGACVEEDIRGWWVVWNVPREVQARLTQDYWPTAYIPRRSLGAGRTEEEAWYAAVRNIGRLYGRAP